MSRRPTGAGNVAAWPVYTSSPWEEIADLLGVGIEMSLRWMPGAQERASVRIASEAATRRPRHRGPGPRDRYPREAGVVCLPKRERAMTIRWIWLVPS